jgi:hypothetical protein
LFPTLDAFEEAYQRTLVVIKQLASFKGQLNDEAKFVVAIDSDYSFLLNCLHNHSRIVETKCHSIENLMLFTLSITSIIQNLSHDIEYEFHGVNSWLDEFDLVTYPLMIADLLIQAASGVSVSNGIQEFKNNKKHLPASIEQRTKAELVEQVSYSKYQLSAEEKITLGF